MGERQADLDLPWESAQFVSSEVPGVVPLSFLFWVLPMPSYWCQRQHQLLRGSPLAGFPWLAFFSWAPLLPEKRASRVSFLPPFRASALPAQKDKIFRQSKPP